MNRSRNRSARPRRAFPAARLAAVSAVFAALLVALALSCATNPVTGKRELSLVSTDQELAIGKDGYGAVISEYGVYDDPRLQAYVDSIGQALARVSHLPNLQWKFTVLDDPAVNAFAMPGGYIYITRGILAHLNSEAQLAGVLGHEIGHVTARHSARQITQQQLATLGLGVASMLSQTVQQYSQAAQTALGLMFLKYGRDDENQADELGVGYTAKAGWDPREIPATYQTLSRIGERAGQSLPGFLSTHPDPGDRQTRTTELARTAAAGKSGLRVLARGFVSRLDGVVFGNDPRQGYFEAETFYHPGLAFQMRFPAGWKYQNARSSVAAQEPSKAAVMQLTLENAGNLTPAQYFANLQTTGKIGAADGTSETVGGFSAWVGRLSVPRQDGTTAVLLAAGIRRSADQFYRMLGQTAPGGDALGAVIFSSVRSFRALTDAGKLAATPDRVKVVSAPRAGTFQSVVTGLGVQGATIEDLAILNNAELDSDVRAGEQLKLVTPGRK
ncbi:MAG: M48 family metalloprotease [Candidatus Eisenbacteria bacterium]